MDFTKLEHALPNVVCITDNATQHYIKLCEYKMWENYIGTANYKRKDLAVVIPMLGEYEHSWVHRCKHKRFDYNQFNKDIAEANYVCYLDWLKFWCSNISKLVRSDANEVREVNKAISKTEVSVVLLFDGLESIFPDVETNVVHKEAVRALVCTLPEKLRELHNPSIGIITFAKRDFLKKVINQNFAQFESMCKNYFC